MHPWLSFHIRPLETPDAFLTRAVRPFLAQHVWPVKGARAFFVRQQAEDHTSIRLRLRGEAAWQEETLRPAFTAWFAGRGEIEEVAYQPEPERFGSAEALQLAEEYFHLSTKVVLDRLDRPYVYGDALYDAMRLHAITAFAAGFIRARASWYFGQLCDQWLPVFFQPIDKPSGADDWQAEVKESFEQSYAAQESELRDALDTLWMALANEKFDPDQPEWLRWLRGNELILNDLGKNMETALPSLLHLTNNRLGVNNQDEVFLNYLLSRAL